ncbi:hypothetical protein [Sporosarcina sp. E16_8]|uniref:hypothetical protein n=1 Tax=Sporosarcina sp. E16_8 TaxID=2789295 RepID=UPI001A9207A7|nr:hypothetical protein [Sporosarcina sp. E16_8]MBO0587042.1 hypothetical protein [Sporosarcina sp. E16_8]
MHWVMWVFWGFVVTLLVASYLVDLLTGRKYDFNEQEKSLNQNAAGADTLREIARQDQQNGPF